MQTHDSIRILMYSHDTYGLGHIRRSLAIAKSIRSVPASVLIVTGSPLVGRFVIPEGIDFVRIPGMIKVTNEEYTPLSMKLPSSYVISIREDIILATAKSFRPHFFIVDKAEWRGKMEEYKVELLGKIEEYRAELLGKIEALYQKTEKDKAEILKQINSLGLTLKFLVILVIIAMTLMNPVVAELLKRLLKF